jgi:hypothetical protein
MDSVDILTLLLAGFIGYGIPLLFWIGTLIFGIVMLKRGGRKPERFFIAGAALGILVNVLKIPVVFVPSLTLGQGVSVDDYQVIYSGIGLVFNIISAVGIICLIYAFWLKFNGHKSDSAVYPETD